MSVVDAMLNCMALNFIMEMDNWLIRLDARLQNAAHRALSMLTQGTSFTDLILFLGARRHRWAMCGMHNQRPFPRKLLLGLCSLLWWTNVIAQVLMIQSLPMCYNSKEEEHYMNAPQLSLLAHIITMYDGTDWRSGDPDFAPMSPPHHPPGPP